MAPYGVAEAPASANAARGTIGVPRTALSLRLEADLQAMAAGDERALRRLRAASLPLLSMIVKRQLRHPALVEEVLQEVYLRLWQKAGRFDPQRGSAWTWMAAIANRLASDHRRRLAPERSSLSLECLLEDGAMAIEDVAALWHGDQEADAFSRSPLTTQRLHGAIADLPGGQRQCVSLAFGQGLSHGEIAGHLQLPIGTVKSWLRRAQARLSNRLRCGRTGPGFSVRTAP